MTNSANIDENKMKSLFKEALVEVIEENQDLVSSILVDVIEDMGLSRAIKEGESSKTVNREEIFKILNKE